MSLITGIHDQKDHITQVKKDDKVLVLTKNEMIIFSYLFLQFLKLLSKC